MAGELSLMQREQIRAIDVLNERKGGMDRLLKRPRFGESTMSIILFLCGAFSILTTIGIVIVLGNEAVRFFSTTAWVETNKRTVDAIDAEQTIITVTTSGTPVREGDILRVGQFGEERMRVVGMVDEQTVEVERGIEGTTAVAAAANLIFTGYEVSLREFLIEGTHWSPAIGRFGVRPLVTATLVTSVIAMIIAVPLGLGAAVYLSEYANQRVRNILKPILEILAGVPTVVYGYFALTFVTPALRDFFGAATVNIYNMASAGIVIGILIIPTVASISEDALAAVPGTLRDGSLALGATKFETVKKVMVPAAISGVIASFILAMSRAVGETMIVLLAAGAGPALTLDPFDSAETMAGHIARISTGDLSFGSIDYNSLFAVGITLFLMTLVLNLLSTIIVRRYREVY
jgi:phosphate transport system permease protein